VVGAIVTGAAEVGDIVVGANVWETLACAAEVGAIDVGANVTGANVVGATVTGAADAGAAVRRAAPHVAENRTASDICGIAGDGGSGGVGDSGSTGSIHRPIGIGTQLLVHSGKAPPCITFSHIDLVENEQISVVVSFWVRNV